MGFPRGYTGLIRRFSNGFSQAYQHRGTGRIAPRADFGLAPKLSRYFNSLAHSFIHMPSALIPGFATLIPALFRHLPTKLSTFFGKPVCLHSRNVQNRYVLEYKEVVGKLSSSCPKLVSLFSSSLPTSLSTG
ncbi:hypothetical protein [Pseudoduganella aquatica]|uniref:Uncharacterized protein n=1 Tax=Pseudoduganella aquatica TaxID=2660641 RepID=A0A7X4H732_9BURK|nr:hypothetical protein [Pseudoduganella aquatica]MYN05881.1 hypothetical protein [Pseudoduganella aquatica]